MQPQKLWIREGKKRNQPNDLSLGNEIVYFLKCYKQ